MNTRHPDQAARIRGGEPRAAASVRGCRASGARPRRVSGSCGSGLLLAVFMALLGMGQAARAANPPAAQVYFVPFPENDLLTAFQVISGGAVPAYPMQTYIYISSIANNNLIYYDHWEDGYEADLANPTQSTTQIWGDGTLANGAPPGCAANGCDVINAGSLVKLINPVAAADLSSPTTPYKYNARDKIGTTKAISVARTGWASGPGGLLASGLEMYDTSKWGTDYRAPVGTNALNQLEMFEYTGFSILAAQNGTHVQVDKDNNGTFETDTTINQGQTVFINGGVLVGGHVVADKPVMVDLLTGDIGSNYESRDSQLLPTTVFSTDYYSPAGTHLPDCSSVWLYNNNPAPITVTYTWRSAATGGLIVTKTVSVPANSTQKVNLSTGYLTGSHWYTTGIFAGKTFYAFYTADSDITVGGGQIYDWGFTLVPKEYLTSQFQVALGIGRDPTSAIDPSANDSPVWVTPIGNGDTAVTIYVDYNGDNAGAFTDANGNKYDTTVSLRELEAAKLYDPDGDQSGMIVYTLNQTALAGAWGQDSSHAYSGSPGLDAGTSLPSSPEFVTSEEATILVDADGNGLPSPGDTLQYRIHISNVGRSGLPGLQVKDLLSSDVDYSAGTTQYRTTPTGTLAAIADNGSGSAFPLDESGSAGYSFAQTLPIDGEFQIVFNVVIKPYAQLTPGAARILNTGTGIHGVSQWPFTTDTPLYGSIGDRVWLDADNNGVQNAGEPGILGLTVFLDTDNDGTLDAGETSTTTGANGIYTFPGLLAGTYNVRVLAGSLPTGAVRTFDLDGTGTANVAGVVLNGGQARTDADFGYRGGRSIGDTVWNDANGNGAQTGESGIANVRVYLDTNANGSYDAGEPSATTNASGIYSIGNLLPGSYAVRVDTTSLPVGYVQTYDLDGLGTPNAAVATLAASNLTTLDFGYQQQADLALTKTDGVSSVNAGGTTSYTITVTNNGPGEVTAAAVTDSAPTGLTFGAWTCAVTTAGSGGTVTTACGAASGSGNLNTTVTMKRGAVITYTVAATVADTATGSLANTATVAPPAGATDPTPGNNSATDTDTVTVTPVADLALTKTDGVTSVNAGGTTSYTLTVTNNGPSEVTAAAVTDTAPTGLTLDAWTCAVTTAGSGGTVTTACGAAAGSGNLATTVTMKSGAVITYTVAATVADTATGSLANRATVAPPGGTTDPTPANNSATDTDTVTPAGAIGNYVWYDSNHDGIQDAAESGIGGMTVNLFDSTGTSLLAATQTDGSGLYRFDGLAAGAYVVQFVPPTGLGYVASPANQGSGSLAAGFDSTIDAAAFKATLVLTNAADLTIDAGFYRPAVDPARIGDRVWYDTNQNGIQDSGEPGLGGVTVRLLDADHGNALWATAVSDGNGAYEFTGLPAGNFVIDVVAPAGYTLSPLDAGGNDASDSDANAGTGLTGTIALAAGQALGTVDAGLYLTGSSPGAPAASIGDVVWYDSNGEGSQDSGEPGIPGVEVRLYDAAGTTLLATTRTSPTGAYGFSGLAAGSYTVAFVKPNAGYVFSPTGAGTSTTDSDADPVTGRVLVSVTAGQARSDIDAGLRVAGQGPISIGDYVWKDLNANHLPDRGEGLGNARVVLYDRLGFALARLTTNAADTNYGFTGVAAGGSYRVAVDTGTVTAAVQIADPDATLDNRTDLIGQAVSIDTLDFGYSSTGTVSGHLYIDTNGNGTQDSGEPNLADLDVIVTEVTGSHTVHSGPDGNYSATVEAGPVTLDVDATDPQYPAGYTQTQGSDPTTVTATAGQNTDAGSDGYAPAGLVGTVSGHLYIDTDGNAAQGAGEPNLANVDVLITDRFGGTQTVHSDGNGNYTATVPAGTTTADVQESDPDFPAGYRHTQGDDPSTATAVAGTATSIGSDGYAPPASLLGTVTGHVYIDTNGNHAQDPGEPDVAALNVIVTDVNGGTRTLVTGADGNWSATVVAGLGSARLDTAAAQYPAGYSQSQGDDPTAFTAIAQQGVAGGIDGFAPASTATVTGHLYIDSNGNGVQDPGEPNLPALDVIITDVNGGTHRVTSAGSGDYSAAGVPTGNATVDVDNNDPQYPTGYTQTEGTDPTPVTVPAGGTVSAGNDGYQPPVGSIGNRVWLDEDGDGVQDAGEAGIPNLKVELRDSTGNTVIATTYTDGGGGYLFADVPAGLVYQVRVTPTDGLNPTYDEDGSGSANLSAVASFPAGTEHLSADFGYNWVPPIDSTNPAAGATGAIGDRVWNDVNGNGLQDAGEAGLAGVTVRLLTDTNRDGVYETATATATTDGAGYYIFDGLTAAAYVVEADSTTLPPDQTWTQTGDPDGGTADHRTTTPVILAPGDVYVNADFGYQPRAGSAIGERVYLDANGNGRDDGNSTDPGIGGVSVALVKDTNANHQWDDGEPIIATNLTAAAGFYRFAGLSAGDYLVVATDTANVLGALVQTGDPDGGNDGVSATRVDGVNDDLTQDHGYAPRGHQVGAGLIGDTIFLDRNGNGAVDAGEGLAGVTVELYAADGLTLLDSVHTNGNGQYAFGGLATAAAYQVAVVTATLPNGGTGLTNTVDPDTADPGDNRCAVTLTTGSALDLAQDFGYAADLPNTIGGTLWIDADADGTLNEPGRIAGVTVALRDGNGNLVGTTVTGVTGDYSFTGLPAGTYTVQVSDPSNQLNGWWKSDGPNAGADGNSQLDPARVSVTGGATDRTGDFGYYRAGAALGNRAWSDANDNGLQDPGETGAVGVKISLAVTYPNGDLSTVVTVSDGSGAYRFGNLLLDEGLAASTAGTPSIAGLPGYRISAQTTPAGYVAGTRIGVGNGKDDSDPHAGVTAAAIAQGDTDTTVIPTDPRAETNNAAYDFAYLSDTLLHSISGVIYNDSNGNGNLVERRSVGGTETALTGPSITLTLYTDDGTGHPGTPIGSPVVTTDGTYRFTNLPAGHYVVVETNPTGYTSTNDVAPPNDDRILVTVSTADAAAQDFLDTNAPSQLGRIAGQVRNDQNGDGDLSTGSDPGRDGVTVELWLDSDGNATPDNLYDSAVTVGGGLYGFTSVPPGDYVVLEINPGGYVSTNDVSAPNDDRIPVSLPAGSDVTGRDFLDAAAGDAQVAPISGRVSDDQNGNGSLNERGGEPGLVGVTVTLWTDLNGDGDPRDGVPYQTLVTGTNGTYSLPGVPAGHYVVVESDPSGYTSTNDAVGANDNRVPVTRTGSTPVTGADFLDSQAPNLASIGNRVWLDENSDGVQDAGEDGISNLTVNLVEANSAIIATAVTDVGGGYLFTGVPAGDYTVEVDTASLPTVLWPIADEDDPAAGGGAATPDASLVTVAGGEEHLTADFGYNWATRTDTLTPPQPAPGAIGDRVWDDANGNGAQEPGEAGIAGVTVRLLTDRNGDGNYGGSGDNAAVTTTTTASGNYIFTGLAAGAYVVEVDTTTLPSSLTWTQTGDPDGTGSTDSRTRVPVILAPGDVFVNADFGYQPGAGHTIGERIYLDANGSGTDQGQTLEPGIAGVSLALLKAGGQVIATTVTDAYGEYAFPGLPAGTYTAVVTDTDHVLGALVQTGDPDSTPDRRGTVVLTAGQDDLDQDFGFAPTGQSLGDGLIGDTIFLDRDADGVAGAGEGLAGVTVRLYAANGATLLDTRVTNEDGTYAFGGLSPNATYVVRVDPSTLPSGGSGLANTADPDGGTASQATRNLSLLGPIDLAADFGYRPAVPNGITGLVWLDPNADGTRQSGESGRFGGVTVQLRDAGGDLVAATVTNGSGAYSFGNLPDGTYRVDVVDTDGVLTGYWHSRGANSQPAPASIAVNGSAGRNQAADFGYYDQGAAIGNRVWSDTNGDGIQQAAETAGLGGVLLKLVITYPNGAVSSVYTPSAAGTGAYSFGGLLLDEGFTGSGSGQPAYVLSVVTGPAGYTPSPANQGGYAKTDSNAHGGTAVTLVKGQTATAVLVDPNSEPANASFDFGYIQAATSCSVICDVYPQTGGDGVVDMRDLTWINAHLKAKVTPGGAAHSGDCARDGKLMVNDITACQAYLSPSP